MGLDRKVLLGNFGWWQLVGCFDNKMADGTEEMALGLPDGATAHDVADTDEEDKRPSALRHNARSTALVRELEKTDAERWAEMEADTDLFDEGYTAEEGLADRDRGDSKKEPRPKKRPRQNRSLKSSSSKQSTLHAVGADSGEALDVDKLLQRFLTENDDVTSAPNVLETLLKNDDDVEGASDEEETFDRAKIIFGTSAVAPEKEEEPTKEPSPPQSTAAEGGATDMASAPPANEVSSNVAARKESVSASAPATARTANFRVRETQNAAPLEIKSDALLEDDKQPVVDLRDTADATRSADDGSGTMELYWFDAKEQSYTQSVDPGCVFLFGKVLAAAENGRREWSSCCLRVRGMYRSVLISPVEGASELDVVNEVVRLCTSHGINTNRRIRPVESTLR